MEWFLRYWALLVAQHGKSNSHDAARFRPLETDHQRAAKTQVKKPKMKTAPNIVIRANVFVL